MLTEQEQQALFKWISKSKLSVSRKAFEMSAQTKYPEKRLNYWMGVDLYAQAKEADKESLTVEEIAAAYGNLSPADKELIAVGWREIEKDVYTPIVQSSLPSAVLTNENKVKNDLFSLLDNYLLTNKNGIYELMTYLTVMAGLSEKRARETLSFFEANENNLTEEVILAVAPLCLEYSEECLAFYNIVSAQDYVVAREVFSGVDLQRKDSQQKTVVDKLMVSLYGENLLADVRSEEDLAKKLDFYAKDSDIRMSADPILFQAVAHYVLFNGTYKQKTDVAAAVYNHGSIKNELLIIARMEQFCRIADALQQKNNSLVQDFIARITPANFAEVRKELIGLKKLGYSNIHCSGRIENKCKEIEKGIKKQQERTKSGTFSPFATIKDRLPTYTSSGSTTAGTLSPQPPPKVTDNTIDKNIAEKVKLDKTKKKR